MVWLIFRRKILISILLLIHLIVPAHRAQRVTMVPTGGARCDGCYRSAGQHGLAGANGATGPKVPQVPQVLPALKVPQVPKVRRVAKVRRVPRV